MSAYIGSVNAPDHNSPGKAAEVWCSPGRVELLLLAGSVRFTGPLEESIQRSFDPIAARNLAALLVRASEEAERMQKEKRE